MTINGPNAEKPERTPVILIKKSEIAGYFTMSEAIDSMASAFANLSSGNAHVPERYIVTTQDNALTFLLKPAFSSNLDTSAIKILTQKNGNPIQGIPTIMGIVLMIDNKTGQMLSIMDGEYITALRTGAASGLATQYLSTEDARNVAIFGCGAQGRTQLKAVDTVRALEKVWIFDTSEAQAESFVDEMQDTIQAKIEISTDLSVLKEVDIICTATHSERPLFGREHIKKGTHINAIGSFKPDMQELDPDIIASSRVYFDDKAACLNTSGDLLEAVKNGIDLEKYGIGEIGELVTGKIDGRISPDDITVFKSVGTAIQDLIVADRIFNKSRDMKFGQEIRLYE